MMAIKKFRRTTSIMISLKMNKIQAQEIIKFCPKLKWLAD